MSDMAPPRSNDQIDTLQEARQLVEQVSLQFPISQAVSPLADTFDWLLDTTSTEETWIRERQSFEDRFTRRWQAISRRALSEEPRLVSDRALGDANYDPSRGAKPWGSELTRVFRASLSELGAVTGEAMRVLPDVERMRVFARAMNMEGGKFILPVISYSPLLESEWAAILAKLNELIQLTLVFEGAVVAWLIGGFSRDVEGRLQLRPQLSFPPPMPGTRVKPVHVLLGTVYEEQCPSLIPLVRDVRGDEPRLSDALLTQNSWHRVVVQIAITTDDYELLNLNRLSDIEREISRRVMYLDQRPREPHVLEGTVHKLPRPWVRKDNSFSSHANSSVPGTRLLPPQPALKAASESVVPESVQPPTAQTLRKDAEELRRKGMAAVATDPMVAQKYLLSSTVLENNSVDVWLTLVNLATSAKQKEAFRREAEKVLRRQRRNK